MNALRFAPLLALLACQAPTAPIAPAASRALSTTFPAMTVGIGSHGSPNEAAQIRGLGMRHTRVTFYTYQDGPAYRARFTDRLATLRASGLEVLVVVHDFPNRALASDTMADLARHFPGTLWQVGNEWDATPADLGTGAAYAQLMREVLPKVQAADPTARLVGMGLATCEGDAWQGGPVVTFTRDYLAAGGPILTAWSLQVYGVALGGSITTRVARVRQVLGDRMPLWLTETGADRDGIFAAWGRQKGPEIDRLQASQTLEALETAGRLGVERVYLYQLWTGDDYGFGVYRADGVTERPVVQALRGAMQ